MVNFLAGKIQTLLYFAIPHQYHNQRYNPNEKFSPYPTQRNSCKNSSRLKVRISNPAHLRVGSRGSAQRRGALDTLNIIGGGRAIRLAR